MQQHTAPYGWTSIAVTAADKTTLDVRDLGYNGTYAFRIYSVGSSASKSSQSASAACTCIGGPDVTVRLIRIAIDLDSQIAASKSSFVTLRSQFIYPAWGNWDITELYENSERSNMNSGILPDGTATVTVSGEVFKDYEANYWLYGAWARALHEDLTDVLVAVTVWRSRYAGTTTDGADLAACKAFATDGYYGNFNSTRGLGLPNVAPSPPPPSAQEGSPMSWHVGHPTAFWGSD